MKVGYRALILCLAAGFFSPAPTVWAQSSLFDGNQGGGLPGMGVDGKDIVKLNARFTPPAGKQPAMLFITAEIKQGWHIYSITQAAGGPIRTKIQLVQSPQYRLAGEFKSQPPPKKEKEPDAFGDLAIESHSGTVTWYAPLELAPGADPARLRIDGKVSIQPCDANACLPPRDVPFSAVLGRGMELSQAQLNALLTPNPSALQDERNQVPASLNGSSNEATPSLPGVASPEGKGSDWRPYTAISFKQQAGPTFDEEVLKKNIQSRMQTTGLLRELLLGFLGGIILNLMPCVLPVIGLKIISFVEQSGKNRLHAFLLNVWYSAGLISVFLILAALAAFTKLGWGQLFMFPAFNVAMAAVVFVMGLSFLGVWEIPIPGFIGSGKTAELAQREGLSGAFAKGIVTTILATPCTGPFMASALAWAVSQPPQNTFLVFASVGLGMASPYLLIGAFPELIRFLPKPGAWMDTFKHVMGFVLMATVVYIFTFLEWAYIVPTVGLLMAFWAGCWWISRTPLYAEISAQLRAWVQAGVFVAVIWVFMFPGLSGLSGGQVNWAGLYEVMNGRLNESYQRCVQRHWENLQLQGYTLIRDGGVSRPINSDGDRKTIVVDFTADWCATCKTLEATILNSDAVRQTIRQNGIVMMKADWTHEDPQVTAMLDLLGARQVPTLAIFPADRRNDPIIFRGWYGRQDLLEALSETRPSK
jgi:thiol:disulfide interchange protein DsbD